MTPALIISQTVIWIALIGAAVVGGIAVTVSLRRRRRSVWQTFAQRNGLRYADRNGAPHVSGDMDGRRVTLAISSESSDSGPFGVEDIRLSVSFRDPAPDGMTLESATGLIGTVQHMLTERQVRTGDLNFDQNVVVTANNEADVSDWLTPSRRAAFLAMVQAAPSDVMRLESAYLEWQCRSAVSDLGDISRHLERLMTAASAMDARE